MSMPSRAYASFLPFWRRIPSWADEDCVNALTGLCLISTFSNRNVTGGRSFVSMPSRAYASFLQKLQKTLECVKNMCQCPHGLMPHFYCNAHHFAHMIAECVNALTGLCLISTRRMDRYSHGVNICVNALTGLCLISTSPTFHTNRRLIYCVNALTGLCLISTVPLQKPRFYAVSRACFCRYLSEYSDSNCFSCMLTI